MQAAGIALWACDNNEGALHLAGYLVKHHRTVMPMADADSRTTRHFKTEKLIKAGLDLTKQVSHVGESDGYNELEKLFSDLQWAAAANPTGPALRASCGAPTTSPNTGAASSANASST
ncbi:hypothetical protein [Streptomyces tendae]|uniref:hypothetical protein n=1 Tax=Streptomyces tendae TaxID=1932 RepID=UPI0033B6BF97